MLNVRKWLQLCVVVLILMAGSSFAAGQSPSPDVQAKKGKKQVPVVHSSVFREIDSQSDLVEQLESKFQACLKMRAKIENEAASIQPKKRILDACRGAFSVDAVAQDFAQSAPPPFQLKVAKYYQCLVVVTGNYSLCDFLKLRVAKKLSKETSFNPYTLEESCRSESAEALLSKALITDSANAKKSCEDECRMMPAGYRKSDPGDEFCKKACFVLVDNRHTPGDVCAKRSQALEGMPAFEKFEMMQDCRSPINYGLQGACSSVVVGPGDEINDNIFWVSCMSFGAFRKAYQAQDITLCGDYPLCRAMMGDGASCHSFVGEIKDAYCGQAGFNSWPLEARYSPAEVKLAERDAELGAKLSQLDGTCGQILTETGTALNKLPPSLNRIPLGTPGIDQRRARHKALKDRFDDLTEMLNRRGK